MNSVAAVEVRGVHKRYGGLQALKDISFTIERGSIVGLIGPNGAGKSTLFQIISGDQPPTTGEVFFAGENVTRLPTHSRRRAGLSRTFQHVRLFETLTAAENIAVAALECLPRQSGGREAEVERILDLLDMRAIAHRLPNELTLADRKKVEIGRAMAGRCEVLLLDESLSGLTKIEAEQMTSMIRELNRRTGITVIVVEHVIPVVMALAQRLIVLSYGQIIADGSPETILRDERVVSAYLGSKHGSRA